MNLTLSLGISNNGGTTRKRKLWDGVDDVGDGSSGGDRGRVIMRLLHAREERMTARQETDDEPRAAACSYTDDDAAGGIRLMRLLLSSAAASKAGDARAAAAALHEVYRRASFRGGDPAQRVAAYFADALASSSRILIRSPAPTTPPPTTERPFLAYTMFYQASPLYQLAHFTANQAIVEAFEAGAAARRRRLHVVDFDVAYGFQWPSLIQSLSAAAAATTSTSGSGSSSDGSCDEPVSLRITGLGASADELRRTESRLTRFASGCPNLRFEFEGIVVDNGAIRDGIINIKTDDDATVVVNLVFPDARNASREECGTLLARVRSLNPALVVLVEKHDSSGNARSTTSSVLPRFTASLRYFAAVFDSLHECLPADSAERLAIERNHLGTEISSAVASLHDQRRHDDDDGRMANTWKEMMESAGFEGVKLSYRTVSQAKLLLKMKSGCCSGGGFRVVEGDAGKAMSLGWRDTTALITATAWRRRSTSWATHKFID